MFLRQGVAATLLLLFAGCASMGPPEPSVRERYLQSRMASPLVDHTKPCRIEQMRPMDVRVIRNRVFVPALVDGVQTIGFIDTGSDRSIITPELAAAAKAIPSNEAARRSRGISGSFSTQSMTIGRVQFGTLALTGPLPVEVYPFGGSKGTLLGLLIGQDLLDGLDWDLDLPHGQMTPYRTQNCLAVDPPWPDTFTGLALTRGLASGLAPSMVRVATTLNLRFAPTIPVQFDGGSLDAAFDTGAGTSFLSRRGADMVGVSRADLDRDPVELVAGLDGRKVDVYRHTFPEIAVGEAAIHDFPMSIAQHFDRRDTFQMILGMDYIGKAHLWLSYTTNASTSIPGRRPRPSTRWAALERLCPNWTAWPASRNRTPWRGAVARHAPHAGETRRPSSAARRRLSR